MGFLPLQTALSYREFTKVWGNLSISGSKRALSPNVQSSPPPLYIVPQGEGCWQGCPSSPCPYPALPTLTLAFPILQNALNPLDAKERTLKHSQGQPRPRKGLQSLHVHIKHSTLGLQIL